MLEDSQAEMVSAYVDGELTDEERHAARQLLEEEPAARQLADDLSAIRCRIEALPRHRLDDGFAAAVLRAAEREMLLSNQPATEAARPAVENDHPPPPVIDRRSAWRSPIWFASGAAAAVLLMTVWPEKPLQPASNQQLAMESTQDAEEFATVKSDEEAADRFLEKRDVAPNIVEAESPEDATLSVTATADTVPADALPSAAAPAMAADDVILVMVRLTEDAARQQVVDRVLRSQGIALVENAAPTATRDKPLEGANTEGANTEGANIAGANTAGANTEQANTEQANRLSLDNVSSDSFDTSATAGGDELIFVESSLQQLRATLAELGRNKDVVADAGVRIPAAYFFQPLNISVASDQSDTLARADALPGEETVTVSKNATPESLFTSRQYRRSQAETLPQTVAGKSLTQSRAVRLRGRKAIDELFAPAARGTVTANAGTVASTDEPTSDIGQRVPAPQSDAAKQPAGKQRLVRSLFVLRVVGQEAAAAEPSSPADEP